MATNFQEIYDNLEKALVKKVQQLMESWAEKFRAELAGDDQTDPVDAVCTIIKDCALGFYDEKY